MILGTAVVWFGLPLLLKKGFVDRTREFNNRRDPNNRENENSKDLSFREFNEVFLVTYTTEREEIRVELEEKITKLKTETNESKKKKLKERIHWLEVLDKFNFANVGNLHYRADNAFFFSQSPTYWEGKKFWKLLNDISWWNLTGFIVLFFLVFNTIDSIFFHPLKDGEEVMVLTFTPGVKRSDIFFAKILAFLTFYSLANVVLFLLPFGFYYFWVGETSLSAFALLTLWTTVIGPILFFGLILTPYLFIKSTVSWLGWIISVLAAFFPQIWFFIKTPALGTASWPYWLEAKFFDPLFLTIISVICGMIFLYLYYQKYQTEDLGN